MVRVSGLLQYQNLYHNNDATNYRDMSCYRDIKVIEFNNATNYCDIKITEFTFRRKYCFQTLFIAWQTGHTHFYKFICKENVNVHV